MIDTLGTQLRALGDPVYRRWIVDRMLGGHRAAQAPATPAPAVTGEPGELPGTVGFGDLAPPPRGLSPAIVLPGQSIRAEPRSLERLPQSLSGAAANTAFHAFAWLLVADDPALLAALWPAWLERFASSRHAAEAWAPAAAAARAVALLDFARRHGLPAPRQATIDALAAHAKVLASHLAATRPGPSATSALADQGRALFRLGLDLDMPKSAALGASWLAAEAKRLILPSGMSRLASTQRHLALAATYADAWLAARRSARPEAPALAAAAHRLLSVMPVLALPGGLPLVGDIAETLPLGWLDGLLPGADLGRGWTGRLSQSEQAALTGLRDNEPLADLEAMRPDGWLRFDAKEWSGLWHAQPGGWMAPDGCGHQDAGGCELHYAGVPVFVDPGGSRLGLANGAGLCDSASVHGGLQLDGRDPFPTDHSAYSDQFRRRVGGPPPSLRAEWDGVSLAAAGFVWLGGPRDVQRRWRFADGLLTIEDFVNGTGRYAVTRRLLTPLVVTIEEPTVALLEGGGLRFRLTANSGLSVGHAVRWVGYGVEQPLSSIEMRTQANLPWRGRIVVERQ
jgi:hypothetical protein